MKSFLYFVNTKLPYNCVAIGKFDAMHKAHLNLLKLVGDNGCALSIASVIAPFVTPPQVRQEYSKVPFYRLRFDVIKTWSALEFLELLFVIMPKLKKIVVGYDFCFGFNRSSSASDIESLLKEIGREYVEVKILETQKYEKTPIHTSIIKELIKYGEINTVNAMLCRFYKIRGLVISGQGIGAKMLYPTINMRNSLYLLPKFGVYATLCIYKSVVYKSVSFVGNRLSTDSRFCIETHILGELMDFVEKSSPIDILFVDRIRNNIKFSDLQDLKNQITKDIQSAKNILNNVDFESLCYRNSLPY